jgi:SEC-C motif-containing protein
LVSRTAGFAAKKKPNNKINKKGGNAASSNKGFGAAPPSLDEVAQKFKTRLPEDPDNLPCPCGSGDVYASCCAPYHRREKLPETPLRVLQSRYSAFAWRLVPYIIETTHPTCRDYRDNKVNWAKDLNNGGMFDSFEFVELKAGPTEFPEESDSKAYIDFEVRLRSIEGEKQETIVQEKSLFLKNLETDSWLYATGEVRSNVVGLEDTVLNK